MKQRIVGLVVLVALVGVFLPMLFNLDPGPTVDTTTEIPPPPGIEPAIIEQPRRPQDVEAPPAPDELFQPEDIPAEQAAGEPTPAVGEPQQAPHLTDKGVPESWVLQAGSFKDEAGAQSLTKRLQDAGFKAFHRAATVDGARVHRVLVGPKVDRERLMKEKEAIARQFGIEGLILSFEP